MNETYGLDQDLTHRLRVKFNQHLETNFMKYCLGTFDSRITVPSSDKAIKSPQMFVKLVEIFQSLMYISVLPAGIKSFCTEDSEGLAAYTRMKSLYPCRCVQTLLLIRHVSAQCILSHPSLFLW